MASPSTTSSARSGTPATLLLIVFLAVLWIVFSGKLDPIHLGYGVLSIALVVIMSRSLIGSRSDPLLNEVLARIHWGRALVYPFWLFGQIALANLAVARLVLLPSMPIDPVLLRFKTGMKSPLAKVTLGNSITLTPGTVTLRIKDDEFLVHAIHEDLAAGLIDGSMQRKVAGVFGETEHETIECELIRDAETVRREEGW